ncbi:LacI family DNA-binding transcriptional regulator [Dactylosporangium sp. NPDC000244]|uniref:LacI family DNA-binding transcriptional regulator n=1 Tax=Dactylosporangium sp. NPDC000244 TaxID=3154365 RepID=UPI0033234CEF
MVTRRADVAKLAGTSPAVVSYVLNGGPRGVSPETRARVLAAIEQLGYRPNGIARSLRTNRTMTLGLVVPDTSNPFFAQLAHAIEEAAFRENYTLLLGNAAEDDDRQTTYVRTFLARQVDGLFLVPAHGPAGCLPELLRSGVPFVTLDRRIPGAAAPAVLADNRAGARKAVEHLLQHGRRAIACISGPQDVVPANERVNGWRDALAEAGVRPSEMSVWHGAFGRRAGYLGARELLAGQAFDAVFVASDEQAIGVLRALQELGIRCPQDVAVASFDGIAAAAYTTPALTTMAQPFARMGRVVVDRLLDAMDAERDADAGELTVLPVTLLARGSCGCPDPPGGEAADEHEQAHEQAPEQEGGAR